jgi:hypothetical protein
MVKNNNSIYLQLNTGKQVKANFPNTDEFCKFFDWSSNPESDKYTVRISTGENIEIKRADILFISSMPFK